MEFIDNEIVLCKNLEGVMGCDKLSLVVILVGVGVNLEEVFKDVEGIMYRVEDGFCFENLMLIISFDVISVSMLMVEGSLMEFVVDENVIMIFFLCFGKCGVDDYII